MNLSKLKYFNTMNIYLVEWEIAMQRVYDTYSAFVAIAKSEQEARSMHPDDDVIMRKNNWYTKDVTKNKITFTKYNSTDWVGADNTDSLNVKCIGTTNELSESKIILSSYHAG